MLLSLFVDRLCVVLFVLRTRVVCFWTSRVVVVCLFVSLCLCFRNLMSFLLHEFSFVIVVSTRVFLLFMPRSVFSFFFVGKSSFFEDTWSSLCFGETFYRLLVHTYSVRLGDTLCVLFLLWAS